MALDVASTEANEPGISLGLVWEAWEAREAARNLRSLGEDMVMTVYVPGPPSGELRRGGSSSRNLP